MTRTALPLTLAASLALGLLIACAPGAPASVSAAKKPSPKATATATATLTPMPTATPTPAPTDTPVPFTVTAWVDPSTMPYDYYPTLYGRTLPGASCYAQVYYNNGYTPKSFSGGTTIVPSSGLVGWSWHEQTTSSGGTGTVYCTYQGQSLNASARFTVY